MGAPRLIETRASEECGCPEEEWIFRGVEIVLHAEADGSGDVICHGEDWQHDILLPAPATMEDMRAAAFAWVGRLPDEDEYVAALRNGEEGE
jgi:hypothetical protein